MILLWIELLVILSENNHSITPAGRPSAHVRKSCCHVLVIWRHRIVYGKYVTPSEAALEGVFNQETYDPKAAVDNNEAADTSQERANSLLHWGCL